MAFQESGNTQFLKLYTQPVLRFLPLLPNSLLKNRSFIVRIGSQLSYVHPQGNEIHQSSFLSPTLFILGINDIIATISPPIRIILYADDLSINLTLSNSISGWQSPTINFQLWHFTHSFRISSIKTHFVIFQHHLTHPPSLHLPLPAYQHYHTGGNDSQTSGIKFPLDSLMVPP